MMKTAHGSPAVWAFAEHEHRDLFRGINRVHAVACEIGHRSFPDLIADVAEVLGWVEHTLEPHIAWEETWLYPNIDGRLGTAWATRAARFDHQQIREMAAHLRVDQSRLRDRGQDDPRAETRCHLFSLEALLRAHMEREERFLIPLLDEDPPSIATGAAVPPMATSG